MKFLNNRIYFIESLAGNHKESADDLYKYHINRHFNGRSECFSINSQHELIESLNKIKTDTENKEVFPLIHIEAHGLESRKGLVLRNDDVMYWSELRPHFEQINANCCNNLMLCISACSSIYILEEIIQSFYDFGTITPFFTFVGTEDTISVDDLTKAFPEFYKIFAKTKSIMFSVVHMNKFSSVKFRTDTSHSIFRICADKFSDTWIKERGLRIMRDPSLLNGLYCELYNYTYNKDCSIEMINELMVSEQLYIDFMNRRMEDFFIYSCKGNRERFGVVTKISNFNKCEIFMRRLL